MSKTKLFVENFLVYGLGGIISKIIPLIMLPIITRIMPDTSYFGISDMSQTIISFGSSLAILGMYDAMYRMFFEKKEVEYKKSVCSTTLIFTVITSFIVFVVMLVLKNQLAYWFFGNSDLAYVIYLSAIATLVTATNSVIAAPTRMQNKRKIFLVTNTIAPILSYGISIPLLLMGYYIVALPLAGVISGVTMELSFYLMNREWFRLDLFDLKLLKQLLVIAIPLFPNFLIYWIFNSCDRLMITNIIDVGAVGIYAVGSKLGQASQLIYTAFAGGWQYFAFSTMNDENQVQTNSRIFEYLGVISFTATSFVCAMSYLIYKVLFSQDYIDGFIIAPYLFVAPLLQMLFQVEGNQFLVIKKTWPIVFILLGGAGANVVLNLFLIPVLGIEGAAIATLLGYVTSDIVAMIVLCYMKLMKISVRFLISSAIMIVFFVLWRFTATEYVLLGLFYALVVTFLFFFLYRTDIKCMYIRINKKIRKRKSNRDNEL